MGIHHLCRQQEMLDQCLYCSRDLREEKWKSEVHDFFIYKVIKCECGRENRVKLKQMGSGHDDFDKYRDLEIILKQFRIEKSHFTKIS